MIWLLFKAVEYSAESTVWTASIVYRAAQYMMYGTQPTEEEKQLIMIREEVCRLRQEMEGAKEYACGFCHLHLEHRPQRECQCHDKTCPRFSTDHQCFGKINNEKL